VPNLAVEVLSESNTEHEMQRKLQDYFSAGVELVWCIDRQTRSAKSYSAADWFDVISSDGLLDAGLVLPGFIVSLAALFQQADEQAGLAGGP
jgi:Uma2 family endonuclease